MDVFERAAYWWAKQLSPSGEWDNGEKATAGVVSKIIQMGREAISPGSVKIFQDTLSQSLREAKPRYGGMISLQVDYRPIDQYLQNACSESGIDDTLLPCKIIMQIHPETGIIELRRGYGDDEYI